MGEGASGGAWLAVEASFDAQAAHFVDRLRNCRESATLGAFARRWLQDPRPWAREQMFAYVAAPMDVDNHHALVKRLFKGAEERGDAQLMGAFMVAFDRLIRRRRTRRRDFDWANNVTIDEEVLEYPKDTLWPDVTWAGGKWTRGKQHPPSKRPRKLFSYHTRHYLRRRAWRWFRRLGHRDPAALVEALGPALARYEEADLAQPEHLLDSHGLLHAAYGSCDALDLSRVTPKLREGRAMREVAPAPAFESAWAAAPACPVLLDVLRNGRARLLRSWAREMLKRHHAERLARMGIAALSELAGSSSEEARLLFAEVLGSAQGLESLPIADWMRLLSLSDADALTAICAAFRKHVVPGRMSTEQVVTLAVASPAPVARLGLDLLRDRAPTPADAQQWSRLAGARCAAHAREAAARGLAVAGGTTPPDREAVTPFFDATLEPARVGAMEWLAEEGNPLAADPVLWSRIMESPHDDVRLRAVDLLDDRDFLRRAAGEAMIPAWTAVLLGVHRGGRQKLRATAQVADAILSEPARAEALLPVLAVAARSPRAPESRAALAALVRVTLASADLARAVARHVPELQLASAGTA